MQAPQASDKAENAHDGMSIWTLAWSGSERVLTGGLDGSIRIWNSRSLSTPLFSTAKERVGVNKVVASDDGKYCLACYQNSIVKVYNIDDTTGELTINDVNNNTNNNNSNLLDAWSVTISPDNDTFATGTQSGQLHISSISSGQRLLSIDVPNKSHVFSTAFNNDGSTLACATSTGAVTIYDPVEQKILHSIDSHSLPVRDVTYSSDGTLLYTASEDRHVSVYDTRTSKAITSFSHGGMCLSIDTCPDGRHFVVGNSDSTVYLWDLGMQKREKQYNTHSDQIWGVMYDRTDKEGRRFASTGDDGLLQLYE